MSIDNLANQLVYATTKIKCYSSSETSEGTGFFFRREYPDGKYVIALVTNNHVVEGFDKAEIYLAGVNSDGTPNDQNRIIINISDLQDKREKHPSPDIDISLLFIGEDINQAYSEGRKSYYKVISSSMIPSEDTMNNFSSIEDVIMIGYPNGLMDDFNNKPIVRKGITASRIKLDYNGQPDFLIDMACFWGSSGSPVFLRTESTSLMPSGPNTASFGKKISYYFVGILHSGPVRKIDGTILVKNVPTTLMPYAEFEIPLNLGNVTKAKKIVEIFDSIL